METDVMLENGVSLTHGNAVYHSLTLPDPGRQSDGEIDAGRIYSSDLSLRADSRRRIADSRSFPLQTLASSSAGPSIPHTDLEP